MPLKADLEKEVARIFREQWTTRDGNKVPEPEDLKLSNDAVELEATILYADLAASTNLVDTRTPKFAAEIYKSFLLCAARVIGSEGGSITAYDGDRVMGVFIGDLKNTRAVRASLKINYAREKIINPAMAVQYPTANYSVNHSIGIDTSKVLVARTGVRGANDLVWVGRAANYAAKLSALPSTYSWITGEVYDAMIADVKVSNGKSMWEQRKWTAMADKRIYRSNWIWAIG